MKGVILSFASLIQPNVAFTLDGEPRRLTKDEIMTDMSMEQAYQRFLSLDKRRNIDSSLAQVVKSHVELESKNLRQVRRHREGPGEDINATAGKLNELILAAEVERDKNDDDCGKLLHALNARLEDATARLATINSGVTAKSGEMLGLVGDIEKLKVDMQTLEGDEERRKYDCDRELGSLRDQHTMAEGNLRNMDEVMKVISECDQGDATAGLIQQQQCIKCDGQEQVSMIKDERFENLVKSFTGDGKKLFEASFIHKSYVPSRGVAPKHRSALLAQVSKVMKSQSVLGIEIVDDGCAEDLIGNGTSYRGCQDLTVNDTKCVSWTNPGITYFKDFDPAKLEALGIGDHNYCRNPGELDTIWCFVAVGETFEKQTCEAKEVPAVEDEAGGACVESNECKIGKGSCKKMFEKLSGINFALGAIVRNLTGQVATKQESCDKQEQEIAKAMSQNTQDKQTKQTDLAAATSEKTTLSLNGATVTKERKGIADEFAKSNKECCDERNAKSSDICALEKIRGQIMTMNHMKAYITDCEVSDWVVGECDKTCGGGNQVWARTIVQPPDAHGAACLDLQKSEGCNDQPCPVDCTLSEWASWGTCTAACGGGTRTRTRQEKTPAKHVGKCDVTLESEGCNTQGCNANCVLAEWGAWSERCSKDCGPGTTFRRRAVEKPQLGDGTCPDEDATIHTVEEPADVRLEVKPCIGGLPPRECGSHIGEPEVCASPVDLLLLLDASASVTEAGWVHTKSFAKTLLEQNFGLKSESRAAVMKFSGPGTWSSYDLCRNESATPNLAEDCKIEWKTRLGATMQENIDAVRAMQFTEMTTFTSKALIEAGNEAANGAADKTTVVVVVTDGMPLDADDVSQAQTKLKEKGLKVVYVPVTRWLSAEDKERMIDWSTFPASGDNVIFVQDYSELDNIAIRNRVVATVCPNLMPRAMVRDGLDFMLHD